MEQLNVVNGRRAGKRVESGCLRRYQIAYGFDSPFVLRTRNGVIYE
jgi:hypothetical protein